MTEIVNSNIFDTDPNYSTVTGSLFLERRRGLLDSINKRLPMIWALYKQLKTMDWDENEFPYKDCKNEFISGDKDASDAMIENLGWQWETDSIAAHHLVPLMAPFVSSSEYWVALCEIQRNENVHGLTYSEIVRGSFDNPDEVMQKVLKDIEPLQRLTAVTKVMAQAMEVGAKILLGQVDRSSDLARDTVMKLLIAIFAMERNQFMPSFAVTFAVVDAYGAYMPIGKAVQKICNDEFNIHVEVQREALRNELATEVGRLSYERIKPEVDIIVREIIDGELNWTQNYMFRNGRKLPISQDGLVDFVRMGATDTYNELPGLTNPYGNVTENPLPFMEDWVEMDKNQGAPQEEKNANYLLGGMIRMVGDKKYDIAGI